MEQTHNCYYKGPLLIVLFLTLSMMALPSSVLSRHVHSEEQPEPHTHRHRCPKLWRHNSPTICDPDRLLTAKERHSLRQRLREFRLETANFYAKEVCERKGQTVSIVLSKRQFFTDGFLKSTMGPCPKAIFLFIPIYELDHMMVYHSLDLPLKGHQIYHGLERQKALLRKGHYLEAVSGILDEMRLMLRNSTMHRHRHEEERESELYNTPMSLSFLLLVAFCATLCSLLLFLLGFTAFYYASIIHRGGFACWDRSTGDHYDNYYYSSGMSRESTVVTDGEDTVEARMITVTSRRTSSP